MKVLFPIRRYDINEVRDYALLECRGVKFEHILIDDYIPYVYLSPHRLDELYRERDTGLISLYREIESRASLDSVMWIRHGSLFHPDFINSLRVKAKVLLTTDDPEGSYLDTFPYCRFYDLTIHAAVYYSDKVRMREKLREWGAMNTYWMPLGVYSWRYNANMTIREIIDLPKEIDILFVGAGYSIKRDFIIGLKKHFGRRMKIYGHWGGKRGFVGRAFKGEGLDYIRPLDEKDFVSTHLKSLIGINRHFSYGPSNQRQFILPANGVLQVTDLPGQTCDVFDIGREVLCYEDLASAILLCEYYLTHEKDRREVAINAYTRTMRDYVFTKNLSGAIDYLRCLL